MAAGPLTRGGLVAEEDCWSRLIRRLLNTDNLTRRLFIADRIASVWEVHGHDQYIGE